MWSLPVRLRINGKARQLELDSRQSLLDVLRETLDLTAVWSKGTIANGERSRRAMQRSLMWIATAVLFVSVLSGQGEVVGMTVQSGANGPAGNGIANGSPGDTPRHDSFEAIPHAPSESNCQRDRARSDVLRDRARSDVFELQCESNSSSN